MQSLGRVDRYFGYLSQMGMVIQCTRETQLRFGPELDRQVPRNRGNQNLEDLGFQGNLILVCEESGPFGCGETLPISADSQTD